MAPTEVMEQITQVWHILESKTSWSLRRSLSDRSVHPPQPRESQLVNPTPNDVPPPTALPSMPPPSPTSAQSSAPPPHPSTASLSLAPRPAPPQVLYESSGSSLYSPSSSFLAHYNSLDLELDSYGFVPASPAILATQPGSPTNQQRNNTDLTSDSTRSFPMNHSITPSILSLTPVDFSKPSGTILPARSIPTAS